MSARKLKCEPLRLPEDEQAELATLAEEMESTRGKVSRSMVLFGLLGCRGFGGPRLAAALRLAASDPTVRGARKALEALGHGSEPADTERNPATKRSA
jgi:hypothetical protein